MFIRSLEGILKINRAKYDKIIRTVLLLFRRVSEKNTIAYINNKQNQGIN